MTYTDELIKNPSNITKHLIEIILKIDKKYNDEFNKKGFINKLKRDVKLNYYAKEDYNKFYSFLILYNVAIHTGSNIEKIKKYFQEFEIIYDKIIFNNLALVSESIKTKKAICQIITMEELKIQYFK